MLHRILSTSVAISAIVLAQGVFMPGAQVAHAQVSNAQGADALNDLISGSGSGSGLEPPPAPIPPKPEPPKPVPPKPEPPKPPVPAPGTGSGSGSGSGHLPPHGAPLGLADAGAPSLSAPIRVSQAEISAGAVSFRAIMEIGRHLFTQSFTPEDGYGEGPTGPRELKRRLEGSGGSMAAFAQLPWMRINGLDAQACLECHSVGGMDRLGVARPAARSIRTDGLAGTGGVSAAAIINPMRQEPPVPWVRDALLANGYGDPDNMAAVFLRNPPHVFGAGYTQTLAEEMSFDLLHARLTALRAAADHPGTPYRVALRAHGTDFGSYVVTVPYGAGQIDFATLGPCGTTPGIDEICDGIDGVGADFVVRPFQWKGIASNMRNFVRDALNFHFAMMPVELAPGDADPDGDGVPNEVSVGEVTALTAFALAVRPPVQVAPSDPAQAAQVARGLALFEGRDMPPGFGPDQACAACHHVSKTLYDPVARIQDPRTAQAERFVALERGGAASVQGGQGAFGSQGSRPGFLVTGAGVGLGQAAPRGLALPVERYFRDGGNLAAKERAEQRGSEVAPGAAPEPAPGAAPGATSEATRLVGRHVSPPPAYAFNLSFLSGQETNPLSASLPRLPISPAGRVEIRLYSDLKRHNMGRCLADIILQQTDREGVFVPREDFLTRPLWGVADTGPWLHDGRALTLMDAILMHSDRACADDGSGLVSAANDAVDAFALMSDADQQAILAFLSSLRLPRDPG